MLNCYMYCMQPIGMYTTNQCTLCNYIQIIYVLPWYVHAMYVYIMCMCIICILGIRESYLNWEDQQTQTLHIYIILCTIVLVCNYAVDIQYIPDVYTAPLETRSSDSRIP